MVFPLIGGSVLSMTGSAVTAIIFQTSWLYLPFFFLTKFKLSYGISWTVQALPFFTGTHDTHTGQVPQLKQKCFVSWFVQFLFVLHLTRIKALVWVQWKQCLVCWLAFLIGPWNRLCPFSWMQSSTFFSWQFLKIEFIGSFLWRLQSCSSSLLFLFY